MKIKIFFFPFISESLLAVQFVCLVTERREEEEEKNTTSSQKLSLRGIIKSGMVTGRKKNLEKNEVKETKYTILNSAKTL